MAQFLRPDSDITTTNVSAGTFASVDEVTASDTDFVIGTNNTTATYECGLTNPQVPAAGTCTVRFRHALGDHDTSPFAPATGGANGVNVTCEVVEATTVLVTDTTQTANDGAFIERPFTFSTGLVTDWNDLRLRWTIVGTGGSPAGRRTGAISWAEIEIPDAAPETVSGSGTPQAATATADGIAVTINSGSGAPQAATATASGTGTVVGPITGSGSPQADTATAAGVAVTTNPGIGAAQADTATASGAAKIIYFMLGSPQAGLATASGIGIVLHIGLGSAQAESAIATGSGSVSGGTPSVMRVLSRIAVRLGIGI